MPFFYAPLRNLVKRLRSKRSDMFLGSTPRWGTNKESYAESSVQYTEISRIDAINSSMDTTLVNNFMKDLKVEAIKLNLQLSCPYDTYQNNDVLGTLTAHELDSIHAMAVIRQAISDLSACTNLVDLHILYDEWNKTRLDIQYTIYEYDSESKGEAYAYVFLMRVLKKRHKDLYSYMKIATEV